MCYLTKIKKSELKTQTNYFCLANLNLFRCDLKKYFRKYCTSNNSFEKIFHFVLVLKGQYFHHKNFNSKLVGSYKVNVMGFFYFCEKYLKFLGSPPKNLGSTPLLLVKITVQWFYFHHKNFNRKSIGHYNGNARANSIFRKNCQSFLKPPKKKLGSTPPLLAKITVQWFYFYHKNFNHKLVGHYNINVMFIWIFGKIFKVSYSPPKKIWAALHHFL